MANLEVVEIVPPVKAIKEYTLKLNQKEFEALMALVGELQGNSSSPLRQVTGPLWKDLFEKLYISSNFGSDLEHYKILREGYRASVD